MDYIEIGFRITTFIVLFIWLFYLAFIGYQITKSPKYLEVKQQFRNVDKARIKAKYEYKLAVLDYKVKRDKNKRIK